MSNRQEQIDRISYYESLLTEARETIRRYREAREAFLDVQDRIRELDEYLGSEAWRQDLLADEAGTLPDGLPRGVLSEDGIWNLLQENRELKEGN